MNEFSKINLLGVDFTDASEEDILEYITKGLVYFKEKYYIVTPNPELLVIASRDKDYKDVLNGARIALPDGIGVVWGSKMIGKPLKERITGVDLTENLCRRVSEQIVTVGFLGAKPGVADRTAECLQKKYPGLRVKLAAAEWSGDFENTKIDILFVAFGSPKQEIWIKNNLHKLPVRVAIGVGGAFDFISKKVPRAPRLVRRIGFEWLFRLIMQPWRIKRQISLFHFIFLILTEKFNLLKKSDSLH